MIIILTGGTSESNNALLEKLSFPYTLITGPSFATQRSILQSKLPSKNHFIIPCALKSHRYEIHCIARRFNHSFHILLDTTKTDNYEELNGTNDKPIICDYEIEKLKDHDTNYMNKAHTKKTVSGDYMQKVKSIIKTVNQKYNCVFVKECEKRMYNMVNKSVIDIDDIEKVYESMVLESQNK